MNLSAIKRDLAKIRARLEPAVGAGAIHIPAHGGMAALRMAFQAVQGGSPVAAPGRAVGAVPGLCFQGATDFHADRAGEARNARTAPAEHVDPCTHTATDGANMPNRGRDLQTIRLMSLQRGNHAKLLGDFNPQGELVVVVTTDGLEIIRQPGERAEAFEDRIVASLRELRTKALAAS